MSHFQSESLAIGLSARLELVVSPAENPLLQRHCPGCKATRTFASSGKFRVNAQKKLIDVWLIWRCTICGQTWNHAIHERRAVRSLPPAALQAFMRNDESLAQHHGALLAAQIGTKAEDARVERRILQPPLAGCTGLEIVITAPPGNSLRLDRILAIGLHLPRRDVAALAECGALVMNGAGPRALRRPGISQTISLDLTQCSPELAASCIAAITLSPG